MLSDKHILVVDDDGPMRTLLSVILRKAGASVADAPDGLMAFEMLVEAHASGTDYDLMFLDLSMVGLDGFELLELIRADRGLCSLPIVVISSNDYPQARDRAERLGVVQFLAKPVMREDILVAAEEALELAG